MKTIKHMGKVLAAVLLLAGVLGAQAQSNETGVTVKSAKVTRNANLMSVTMEVDLTELTKVKGNETAVFVPTLVNGTKKQDLPAFGIYGRTRWYQYLRSGVQPAGVSETSYRYSQRPQVIEYAENVPYEEWMNGSHLELRRTDYGCCGTQLTEAGAAAGTGVALAGFNYYKPTYHYVKPTAEVAKVRSLKASAYVDYPVDRTEIWPDYRNNRVELSKITATLDSLRKDNDITVSSVTIKGYASPEGSYTRNEELAKGRTEALKAYVDGLYKFDAGFIKTAWEAEDWTGLRERVEASALKNKAEILSVIDDKELDPDTKDWRLKIRFPEEYKVMLETIYPALRRSDYRIEYTVRSYTSVEKIKEVMSTAPQKLSLEEMYQLAQSYEKESDEYYEIFETAARLFPHDATANLNAANAAMSRGDLKRAERYLEKAGTGADATYARGVLAGLKGDKTQAEALLKQAGAQGAQGTAAAIEQLRKVQ